MQQNWLAVNVGLTWLRLNSWFDYAPNFMKFDPWFAVSPGGPKFVVTPLICQTRFGGTPWTLKYGLVDYFFFENILLWTGLFCAIQPRLLAWDNQGCDCAGPLRIWLIVYKYATSRILKGECDIRIDLYTWDVHAVNILYRCMILYGLQSHCIGLSAIDS